MSIVLSNSHLIISKTLSTDFFGESPFVLISYRPEQNNVLIAAAENNWFSKMHKARQVMLKTKNPAGDKSIAIHSLIIDHHIRDNNRNLEYELNAKIGWIKIDLN